MKHKNGFNRWNIINKIFMDNFLAASFIELSAVGSMLIDGIVVSRMMSAQAMASFGIAQPIFSIIAIFFGLFATGMSTICSQELGRGNVGEYNRIFCTVFYISGIFSLISMAGVVIYSKGIAAGFGASGKDVVLLAGASDYIQGIGIGIPAFILCAVLAPALQIDNGRRRVVISSNVDAVLDIILDFAAVKMGLGLFGIGLASSAARYVRLIILMLHFLGKSHYLHFVALKTNFTEFFHWLSYGTEKAWRRLGNVIRPVFVNKLVLFYGGTMAMTAVSVRANICELSEIFAVGLADTVGLLAGIYYGEKNAEAELVLGKKVHTTCGIFCGAVSFILLLLSLPIAVFYSPEGGQVTHFIWITIIGVALQTPLQALVRSRISYLQRVQQMGNMRIMIITSTVVFPIVSSLLLGFFFGVYGVLLCYTLSDLLSLVSIWLYYVIKQRHFRPKAEDYLNLPDDFQIPPGDIIALDIRNMEDVSLTSEMLSAFCIGHKLDEKIANRAAVCFEEMASNTVKHGFPLQRKRTPLIDVRAVFSDNKLIIRLQDNCPKYDVGKRIAALSKSKDKDRLANLGTWLALKLTDNFKYVYSFETNTIFMEFEIKQEE